MLISFLPCSGHHTVNRTPLPHAPVIMHHVPKSTELMSHRMILGTRINLFLLINDLGCLARAMGSPTDSTVVQLVIGETNQDCFPEPHGTAGQGAGFMSLALRKVTKAL